MMNEAATSGFAVSLCHDRCGAGASTKAPPLTKYRYRRRLPHLQKADAAIFVTFCTGGRRVLPEVARDLVLEHCLREAGVARAPSPAKGWSPRIHLYAAVVMPDHVHLLLSPLRV